MWLMPKLYQGLICFENTLSDQARMMYHCNILLMYFPLSPPNSSSASFCPGLIHSLACLMCWSPSHWDQYLQYNQHAWGNIKNIWLYCLDVILEGLLKRSIKTIYVQSLTCVPIYLWNCTFIYCAHWKYDFKSHQICDITTCLKANKLMWDELAQLWAIS